MKENTEIKQRSELCELQLSVHLISNLEHCQWNSTSGSPNFFALSETNLSGNIFFAFCVKICLRQIFSHFQQKFDHETNSFIFPAKNWSCDK